MTAGLDALPIVVLAYSHAHELVSFAIAIVCLVHAWRRHISLFFFVVGAMLYGVALEVVTVYNHHAYAYGPALVMLGPVPLYIGASWGFIMYSLMLMSDASSTIIFSRPILDAGMAVLLDLAMDPVCVRLGHWTWVDAPPADTFFGVPWGNFVGWFIVVTSYGYAARISLITDVSFCTCEGPQRTAREQVRRGILRTLVVVPAALFVCSLGVSAMVRLLALDVPSRAIAAACALLVAAVAWAERHATYPQPRPRFVRVALSYLLLFGAFTAAAFRLDGGDVRLLLALLLICAVYDRLLAMHGALTVYGAAAVAAGSVAAQLAPPLLARLLPALPALSVFLSAPASVTASTAAVAATTAAAAAAAV